MSVLPELEAPELWLLLELSGSPESCINKSKLGLKINMNRSCKRNPLNTLLVTELLWLMPPPFPSLAAATCFSSRAQCLVRWGR